jgi:hypothetical protein
MNFIVTGSIRMFRFLQDLLGTMAPRRLMIILAVAFLIRTVASLFLHGMQFSPETDNYEFGWELGRVARSLMEGHGFSSPIDGETGFTSWMPPVTVVLQAMLFWAFGVYSTGAAIASLLLNGLFSSLTAIPLFHIASQSMGRRSAYWVAWAWALYPVAIFISSTRIWGEPLDALIVTCLVWFAMWVAQRDGIAPWIGFGTLAGLAALTNPNTLSLIPWLAVFAAYRHFAKPAKWAGRIGLAGFTLLAVITPWVVRDYIRFGELVPIKSNFWLEVEIGNNSEAEVMLVDWNRHPASNDHELQEYRRLGEMEYMKSKKRQALSWISDHPKEFVALTARRVVFWWTGYWNWDPRYLASEPMRGAFVAFHTAVTALLIAGLVRLRSNPRLLGLVMSAILSQSAVYYVTHPAPEYRHAVEPLVVMLATAGAVAVFAFLGRLTSAARPVRSLGEVAQWIYARRELAACAVLGSLAWGLDSLMHVLENHGWGSSVSLWLAELVEPEPIPIVMRLLILVSSIAVGCMLLSFRKKEELRKRAFGFTVDTEG